MPGDSAFARSIWLDPRLTQHAALSLFDLLTSPDYVWSKPENLGPNVNGPEDADTISLTADQLSLFWTTVEGNSRSLSETGRATVDEAFGKPTRTTKNTGLLNYTSSDGLTRVERKDAKQQLYHPLLHAQAS